MNVQVEAVRRFIGKPAKDIYGRYIGYIVGITLDSTGKLNSVGVDRGGSFEEFASPQIVLDNDKLLLIPAWRILTDNFRKENSLAHRRFQALDELSKDSEIPSYVYEDLYREYKDALTKLEEAQRSLDETLTKKIEELDNHIRHLEKFLGYLKVQHKTGEMGDETFKLASEYLVSELDNAMREKKDIQSFLEGSIAPKEVKVEVSNVSNVESPEASATQIEPTKSESADKPVVVRLQMEK